MTRDWTQVSLTIGEHYPLGDGLVWFICFTAYELLMDYLMLKFDSYFKNPRFLGISNTRGYDQENSCACWRQFFPLKSEQPFGEFMVFREKKRENFERTKSSERKMHEKEGSNKTKKVRKQIRKKERKKERKNYRIGQNRKLFDVLRHINTRG